MRRSALLRLWLLKSPERICRKQLHDPPPGRLAVLAQLLLAPEERGGFLSEGAQSLLTARGGPPRAPHAGDEVDGADEADRDASVGEFGDLILGLAGAAVDAAFSFGGLVRRLADLFLPVLLGAGGLVHGRSVANGPAAG